MARNRIETDLLNEMEWQRISKEINIGSNTLKLELYEAASHFNIGTVDIPPCKRTEEDYRLQDLLSVDVAQHKSKYQEEMKTDQRP